MAPRQRTFCVVPELPSFLGGNNNGGAEERQSKPPMTTKQAKKLYKEKNKQPRISKAEQRQRDLMEQDRIRREFEKEKNQARAQKARDRKKEKEEKEKAERRRKGLPLVDVHPSQDTLARFIRMPMAKKAEPKPQPKPEPALSEDDSDSTITAEDDGERPCKRRRTGGSPMEEESASPVPNEDADLKDDAFNGTEAQKMDTNPDDVEEMEMQQTGDSPMEEESASSVPNEDIFNSAKAKDVDANPDDVQVKEATSKLCSFDVDYPSVKDMINQQIWNESFPVDEGLFDDIADWDDLDISLDSQEPETRPPTKPAEDTCRHVSCSREHITNPVEATTKTKVASQTPLLGGAKTSPGSSPPSAGLVLTRDQPATLESLGSSLEREICARSKHAPENLPAPRVTTPQSPQKQETRATGNKNSMATSLEPKTRPVQANTGMRRPLQSIPLNKAGIGSPLNCAQQVALKSSKGDLSAAKTPRQALRTSGPTSFRPHKTPSMAPPPLPPKFKSPNPSAMGLAVSNPTKFLRSENHTRAYQPNASTRSSNVAADRCSVESVAPLSTQALLSNIDDLFPSPSQEVRELFEDTQPRPNSHPLPRRPSLPPPPRARKNYSPILPPPSRTSHPSGLSTLKQPVLNSINARNALDAMTPSPIDAGAGDLDLGFLFSTQDISLSSQDLREVEDNSSPMKPQKQETSKPAKSGHSGSGTLHSVSKIGKQHAQARPFHGSPKSNPNPMRERRSTVGKPNRLTATTTTTRTTDLKRNNNLSTDYPKQSQRNFMAPSETHAHMVSHSLLEPNIAQDSQSSDGSDPSYATANTYAVNESNGASRCVSPDNSQFDQNLGPSGQDAPAPTKSNAPTKSAPRPSPKPFFTSSGTREMTLFAIERSKTTFWQDARARRLAQEDTERGQNSDERALEKMLLESVLAVEGQESAKLVRKSPNETTATAASAAQSRGKIIRASPRNSRPRPPSQTSRSGSGSQGKGGTRQRSSWDKMLDMLDKAKGGRDQCHQQQQAIPVASQETDYGGDEDWGDVDLYGIL